MYHSTEQNGFDNSELIKYIVASFHLLVKHPSLPANQICHLLNPHLVYT